MVEQTLLETGNCTEGGVIARWDPEVNGTYNTEGNYWEIKYTNGDICDLNDEPRELILSFTCEPGVEHAIEPVTEQTNCVYEMTIATKYACPGNTEICSDSGNGDDGDSGLSGGWVFIILLIAAFMLYCVIGYVITGLRNKEGNMSDICDNIPNKEFWTKLPSLVCAGCGFTKDFCIALCCRMRGDTDDDFEDIDDKQQNMLTEEDKEL